MVRLLRHTFCAADENCADAKTPCGNCRGAGGFGVSFFTFASLSGRLMLRVFICLRKEKLHFSHPELSQTYPRNSELDDWTSWRQNLINVQSPSPENWTDFLGLSVNELVCLYLDERRDAILHLAIQPVLLQRSSTRWRAENDFFLGHVVLLLFQFFCVVKLGN